MSVRLAVASALGFAAVAMPVAAQESCLLLQRGDGGSPVISARIDDKGPFAFVLDTASSGTTIDERTAADLGLARDAQTETAQGMGGAVDVKFFVVPSLVAGPLALTDFTSPAIPAPDFQSHDIVGLAGVDLFGTRRIAWNNEPDCVTIAPGGTSPPQDWLPVDVQWLRPWKIMLPVSLAGVEGWGLLDTGAQFTVINPVFAKRLGLDAPSGRLSEGGEMTGIDGRPMALSLAEVDDVAVGHWTWRRRTLRVGDLPVFSRLGDAHAPLVIIGSDWLTGHRFAVDYGSEQVWQVKSNAD